MSDSSIYVLPRTDNEDISDYVVSTVIQEFRKARKTYTQAELKSYRTPIEKLIDLQVQLLLINTELIGTNDLYSEAAEQDPYFADVWLDSSGITKALGSVAHLITPIIERSVEMMIELNDPKNDNHVDVLNEVSLNIAGNVAEKYPDLKDDIDSLLDQFSDDTVLPPNE